MRRGQCLRRTPCTACQSALWDDGLAPGEPRPGQALRADGRRRDRLAGQDVRRGFWTAWMVSTTSALPPLKLADPAGMA